MARAKRPLLCSSALSWHLALYTVHNALPIRIVRLVENILSDTDVDHRL